MRVIPRLLTRLILLLALVLTTAPRASVAQQGAPNDLPAAASQIAPTAPGLDIDRLLDAARARGVGVIVVDADGRVISDSGADAASALPGQPAPDPAAANAPQVSPLMHMQDRFLQFRAALIDRILTLPDAFNEVRYILRVASPDGTILAFGKTLLFSLLLFIPGVLVEREIFGKRIARRFVVARVKADPQGYVDKMPFLVFRFVMGVAGILVSMGVAYVLGYAIFGPQEDTAIVFTVTLINIGYFACRFVAGLWRMILSPFLSQYRIPALGDRAARRLHLWLWMVATFDICSILFGIWIAELGLNYDVYAFLAAVLSAVLVLVNMLLVLVNHGAISGALRHGRPLEQCSTLTRVLVRIWAPFVFAYLIFAWFELTYDLVLGNPSSIPLIAGAYGILLSIIVVYGAANFVIERFFARTRAMWEINARQERAQAAEVAGEEAPAQDDQPPGPSPGPPRRQITTFEELARRVAGILAFVAGVYAFFYIWDNEGAEMVEHYLDQLLDIMVILFIGYIVYSSFRIWIDNKIAAEGGDVAEAEPGTEGGASSASRLATLLPLFRNFILIVVVVAVILVVLMEVGISVGPLFAGAGIVGVAIGFGSQSLVRDIFAGAFFLLDDAFRKGEYLDVGGVKGTVEKISVRSFQLRHHLGYLHTIPFGELQVLTNYSRDWVIMKLPLRVTYDTDVEKVRKLIKKLGQELLDDPVIGDTFIQPLKSQGVIEMQDSAMIIRVKFMTKPGDQWLARKRVYEEIRLLFEREGIKFAHREVTVRLAEDTAEDLTEKQRLAVATGAQAALDTEQPAGDSGPAEQDR